MIDKQSTNQYDRGGSKIINKPVLILIDLGASHCYIDPKIVDRWHLEKNKFGSVVHWNQKEKI
jgi:hypothetical protein